ncbi:MAG: C4-dicarboxylate ABC transporter [Rhodospirillaceae bacterium]|nr:C4-dicarboxylate ABC transporter [Rhodospirillaceae bacterium]MDP6644285.1 TRAP transporter large permease subunit [Rhodospirillales bacterium]
MDPIWIGVIGIAVILAMIAARVPIGLALGSVAIFGVAEIVGWTAAWGMIGTMPFDFAAHWSLSAIPMFLLMGTIAFYSGMTNSLYHAARLWLGFLPGGLAVATNFACAGFAAASGSSLATTVAMGRIAIPEMQRYKYDPGLATGVCACSGTLGILIPPSILMVIYGIFAEQSIARLFVAGILPGLLTAALYTVMIVTRCKLNPDLAPPFTEEVTRAEKIAALRDIWPLPVLILGVMGGIYTGVASPTEAGALGAFIALVIALLQRRMTWRIFKTSVEEAIESTATIFFVAVGAILLTKFMALSGLPAFLAEAMVDWALDPLLLVIGASIIFLVLGMFLDPLGLLLLTLPVLLPLFEELNLDLIWFGILVTKYVEIGLMTPPVGLNVYAVKTVVGSDIRLETIFKGVLWFLATEVVVMTLLIAFPEISLFLPSLMD